MERDTERESDPVLIESRGTRPAARGTAERGVTGRATTEGGPPMFAETKTEGVSSPPKQTRTKEIGLIGTFQAKYDDAAHRLRVQSGSGWYPDSVDFAEVIRQGRHGAPSKVSTILQLVSAIEGTKEGTLARIDLLTHGSTTHVALKGVVELPRDGRSGHVEFADDGPGPGDEVGLTPGPPLMLREDPKRFVALRRKFASNAAIHVYSCLAGSNADLVQSIADTFGVAAVGIAAEVGFRRVKSGWSLHLRRATAKRDPATGRIIMELLGDQADYRQLDTVAQAAGLLVRKLPQKDP